MLALPRWKVLLCLLAVLFGLAFTAPNLIPQKTLDSLPGWLPKSKLNLGLDLQGGSYLLLEVDTASLKAEKLNNLLEDTRTTLAGKQIATTSLGLVGGVVTARLADPSQADAAFQDLSPLAQIQQTTGQREVSIASQPGGIITLGLSDQAMAVESSKAVDQSIEIIRRRVDALGTREPSITRQGLNRIVVEAPGESDPEKLKDVIGQTAKLTFQMVDDQVSQDDLAAGRIPPDDVLLPYENPSDGQPLVVKRRAAVTGEMLTDASQGFDQQSGGAIVDFRLNGLGTRRFGEVTSQNLQKRFAIVLDNKIVSAPVIQSAITGGSGMISGNFTPESANQLAIVLRSGALPAQLNVIEQRSVGAELGADAVRAGQISAVLGFAVILVFIVLAYGFLFGGIAVAALTVNGLLLIAAMSLTQATLTLPGVAGMILSLALAVDASVLIYERIRDEARGGAAPLLAADHGFRRAMVSIMDANVTTLIAGAIMFQFGAGPVRGFAWSLSMGVFTSVFSAIVITQVLLGVWFRRKPKALPILSKEGKKGWPLIKFVPAQTHFKFTRLAPFAAVVSGILVLASFGSLGVQGLNLGTDFAGGTVIEIAMPGPAPLAQLRTALGRSGMHDPSVQGFGTANSALLRFKTPDGQDAMKAATGVKTDLAKTFPGINFKRVEVVGPKVSGELMTSGLMALGLAIALMLVYIWFRFQLQFGLGAVIAIFHDLILTVGMLSALHIEFSMTSIAALLTIIGYSMNEKVITFDRLRENLRKYKRTPLREIIDLSENERLSRTLITGSTALLALAGMLFMGGPALFPLVFAMVFGIVVGTYSSIYVALPIILVWGVKRNDEPAEPVAGARPARAAIPRP